MNIENLQRILEAFNDFPNAISRAQQSYNAYKDVKLREAVSDLLRITLECLADLISVLLKKETSSDGEYNIFSVM